MFSRLSKGSYFLWLCYALSISLGVNLLVRLLVSGLAGLVLSLTQLILFVWSTVQSIRRLHDLDKSGWWVLTAFVPFVNFYLLYLVVFKEGSAGRNRFGDKPLDKFKMPF